MYTSFKTISDPITEEEYRNDGRFHYSTLATFARGGFNCIETLFDRKESPSLTFGSAVDALITGGQEEFDNMFMVADFPQIAPSLISIVNDLFNVYGGSYTDLSEISMITLAKVWDKYDGRNWKSETKAKFIIENGNEYYRLKFLAGNKTIISNELYNEVLATVSALKTCEATKWYFADDDPFDDSLERLYQLKFHATFQGLEYSCMADLIVIDHKNKIVYPCDLKTSSHKEYEFHKSFIDWCYHIQARLYWRIIRANMDNSDVFRGYELADYTFIVANKQTLNPLTWKFEDTTKYGELTYGSNNQIECRDPFTLASELNTYLSSRPKVPNGISIEKPNNIIEWLNKL